MKEAQAITEIASVQNRYSVAERQHDPIIDFCASQGILFVPYGPLGADPMKHGAPLASAIGALADVAARLRVSTPQLALAWLLHRSPNIIVIPGTTSKVHLEENALAAQIPLDAESLRQLEQAWRREIRDAIGMGWTPITGDEVVIPRHVRDLGKGLLRSILRQADVDMGLEEFMRT